jgi:hypothetical protein
MPWILNEDSAIKARLTGITIPGLDEPVPVRFSQPEPESPDMTYPSIIITRTGIYRATDREHRGRVRIWYTPEGREQVPDGARWGWYAGYPLPFDLDYQISVYTRTQQDQTVLLGELAREARIPERAGMLYIPQTDTSVTMHLQAGPVFSSKYDREQKRLFEIYYLVRVATEMTPWEIERLTFPDHVNGRLWHFPDGAEKVIYWDETTYPKPEE